MIDGSSSYCDAWLRNIYITQHGMPINGCIIAIKGGSAKTIETGVCASLYWQVIPGDVYNESSGHMIPAQLGEQY